MPSELLSRIEADIETRGGTAVGSGPLGNIPWVRFGRFLGESGYFETELPLRDTRTDRIEEKAHILRFYHKGQAVFVGVVEHTGTVIDNYGTLMMPVSGRCLGGAELSEAKVGFLELTDGSGAGVSDGPADVLTEADNYTPLSWILDTTDGYSTTSTDVYAKFAGESALQALRMIADKTGEHWRFHETSRRIVWLRTDTTSSGARAIQGAPDIGAAKQNPHLCFFESIQEKKDAHGLFNRIYPYGAGNFEIATTLRACSRVAPANFTLSTANNYIQSDSSISTLGLTIPVYVQFPDIRPISNTDADVQTASNALYDAALNMLQRHDSVSDFRVFELGGVVNLPEEVKPGTTIRIVYEDDRYNLDTDLIVLGVETEIKPDASVVNRLAIASVDKFPVNSDRQQSNSMEDGKIWQSHPLRNINSYELGFSETLWHDGSATEEAWLYFDFDDEVTEIRQVVLKFETAGGSPVQMLPLESTVRSVGGSATTTGAVDGGTTTGASSTSSSGSSTSSTTSGGSAHSHTVTISGHQHQININENVNAGYPDVKLNTAANSLEHTGSGGYTVTTNSTTGTTVPTSSNESAHTHGMDHTHGIDHTHNFPHVHEFTSAITTNYGKYEESSANTFYLSDLRFRINGGAYNDLDAYATLISGNRYKVDLTDWLYDSDFRPVQQHNTIEIARKNGSSFGTRQTCTVKGAIKFRTIIQGTAVS